MVFLWIGYAVSVLAGLALIWDGSKAIRWGNGKNTDRWHLLVIGLGLAVLAACVWFAPFQVNVQVRL